MVLQAGIEPARLYRQKILSLLCLPIPPPERVKVLRCQRAYPDEDVFIISQPELVYTHAAICPGASS